MRTSSPFVPLPVRPRVCRGYLGAGNDTLDIGIDADDFVRFDSSVVVDGNCNAFVD